MPSIVDSSGDRDGLPNVVPEAMASRPSDRRQLDGRHRLGDSRRRAACWFPLATAARSRKRCSVWEAVPRSARRSAARRGAGPSSISTSICCARTGSSTSAGGVCSDTRRIESAPADASVACVLKGYPRISELFIASEIYRLEQGGLPLRIFVITQEQRRRIPPSCRRSHQGAGRSTFRRRRQCPTCRSGAGCAFTFPPFLPALRRTLARRPLGVLRAARAALAQSIRARRGVLSAPRKVCAKELLQAVALASAVLEAPDVRHLHAHFCHGATTVTWLA